MYSRKVKYEDYDGNEREVECFFNLNKAELLELQMSWDGGLEKVLEKIVAEHDQKRMIEMFKMIMLKSYGQKSLDGNRFIKNAQLTEEFTQTEAYSELFMLFATDADVASEFINGIIPKSLVEETKKLEAEKSNVAQIPQKAE
ncbi:MAG: hypothetical protein J6Y02_03325 [Pseudobutyrivibrio sp.]|nr:hypothetical protein [Pseudobutyrivibrio sp.]